MFRPWQAQISGQQAPYQNQSWSESSRTGEGSRSVATGYQEMGIRGGVQDLAEADRTDAELDILFSEAHQHLGK